MKALTKSTLASIVIAASIAGAVPSFADVMVGGMPMLESKNIIQNAVNSADHTTLVAAVKAAGLVETLSSKGPFTVFAPVNAAFAALPQGTVQTLLEPANKGKLASILTYHVVAGKLTFVRLQKMIKSGGGKTTLKTVAGGTLIAEANGRRNITIRDENGGVANINVYDVIQSNGVIHSIDKVLLPA